MLMILFLKKENKKDLKMSIKNIILCSLLSACAGVSEPIQSGSVNFPPPERGSYGSPIETNCSIIDNSGIRCSFKNRSYSVSSSCVSVSVLMKDDYHTVVKTSPICSGYLSRGDDLSYDATLSENETVELKNNCSHYFYNQCYLRIDQGNTQTIFP